MVLAALAPDDDSLKATQYRVLELWQSTYEGALRIMLPETSELRNFSTTRPTGQPIDGQRIDSRIPTSQAMNISNGSRSAVAIRIESSSSRPTHSTSMTSSACTPILAGHL